MTSLVVKWSSSSRVWPVLTAALNVGSSTPRRVTEGAELHRAEPGLTSSPADAPAA